MAAAGGMWPAAEVKNEARLGEDEQKLGPERLGRYYRLGGQHFANLEAIFRINVPI